MYMKFSNVDDLCDCLLLLFLTPSCRIDRKSEVDLDTVPGALNKIGAGT